MTASTEATATVNESMIDDVAHQMGINRLKPKQMEAITVFLSGRDVFVALPTGYGKSIIFALLPAIFNRIKGCNSSLAVCISPLTSLEVDLTVKLQSRGINAAYVGEQQIDWQETKRVLEGNIEIVFISPESIIHNKAFRNMLRSEAYKERMVALIVDEAHCVKTWGDKFRTDFSKLGELRSLIAVNVMALTATATLDTLKVVKERLSLHDPAVIGLSPNVPNILYSTAKLPKLEDFCRRLSTVLMRHRVSYPKTIIFCRSYSDCGDIYRTLEIMMGSSFTEPIGYPKGLHRFRLVDMFTRASKRKMKQKVLESFVSMTSRLRVVIATTAFSLGIDCPNIRKVIHYGTPGTIEEYVQETGRAGRDGEPAKACLFYGNPPKDVTPEMRSYGTNASQCRRNLLFKRFLFYNVDTVGEISPKCQCCDNCAKNCDCIDCVHRYQS
ncbi:ATP-dependent DNA helicase Q1-like [Dysidea avara]|uniref:ATP-dependent DNA helicase Q1-like n=2 Tax=Dysidea avara TaxID=196820 RepID=UPI0033201EF9